MLGPIEDVRQLVRRQVVEVEEVPNGDVGPAASTLPRVATASSISLSVTVNGGAKRNAVGVTALTTSPAARQSAAT